MDPMRVLDAVERAEVEEWDTAALIRRIYADAAIAERGAE